MDVAGRSAILSLNHVDVTGVFYVRISNPSLQDPRFCFAAGAIRVDSSGGSIPVCVDTLYFLVNILLTVPEIWLF